VREERDRKKPKKKKRMEVQKVAEEWKL